MQIDAAAQLYTTHLADVRRLSPATVRAYRSDLADLRASVGTIGVAEVDLEHLREWLWSATKRGDARSTLARRTATARGLFAWATETGLIAADPSLQARRPQARQVAAQDRHRRVAACAA